MLIPRITTALVLLLLVVVTIFYMPLIVFVTVITLVMLWAAWEWTSLMGLTINWQRLAYVIMVLAILKLSFSIPLLVILIIACAWWCGAVFLLISYPHTALLWTKGIYIRGIMGVLSIVPTYLSIYVIRRDAHGAEMLLFLLLLVWMADIGAYFAGKLWGKHRLLAQVSPGKTWQGVAGGLCLNILLALIIAMAHGFTIEQYLLIVLLSIVVFCFSVVGDLLESMLKRAVAIKDSGRLLPGHGGLLDRIDSLLAAAPIFLLIVMLFVH